MGVGQIVHETVGPFMRRSTIGGLNNSARAHHYLWTVYWVCLFSIGVILTAIQINSIVQDYYEYRVIVSTDLEFQPALKFPAVTVCNLNRINCMNMYARLNDTMYASKSSNSSSLQTELEQLQAMYTLVGCDDSACTVFSAGIPVVRGDENLDVMIKNQATLRCQDVFVNPGRQRDNQKACYYLYQILNYDPFYNNSASQLEYETAWSNSDCTLQSACIHFKANVLPLITSGAFAEEYTTGDEIQSACAEQESQSGNQTTGKKRKKRQDLETVEEIYNYNISQLENDFLPRFMALDVSTRAWIGNQFDNVYLSEDLSFNPGFLTTCMFLGVDCKFEEMWYQFSDPTYGNCFIFNWAYNQTGSLNATAVRNASLTGASNGLQLELNVDQEDYMLNGMSQQAGFRIVVHDPESYPLMDEDGIDLQPGTLGSIAVQMTNITRLPNPYEAHCIDHWNQTTLAASIMTDLMPEYSMSVCNRFCIQVDIISSCDCYHVQLDMSLINISKVEFQNVSRPCQLLPMASNLDHACFQNVLKSYEDQLKQCDSCNLSCTETVYTVMASTAAWPSAKFWMTLAKNELGNSDIQIYDPLLGPSIQQNVKDNYLKAEIYYQTMNVNQIKQSPKVSSSDLFAALGGALALYLGIAIIMFFELIELLVIVGFTLYDY